MFDIGEPMHAFDAAQIRDHQLSVRKARVGETSPSLMVICSTLTPQDLILVDSAQPVSTAGNYYIVMWKIIHINLKLSCFYWKQVSSDPAMIRHSAARHKKNGSFVTFLKKILIPIR